MAGAEHHDGMATLLRTLRRTRQQIEGCGKSRAATSAFSQGRTGTTGTASGRARTRECRRRLPTGCSRSQDRCEPRTRRQGSLPADVSSGRKTRGKALDSPAQAGGYNASGVRKAPVIAHFVRSAVSKARTQTNRRTSNLAGRRAAQAATFSWADGGPAAAAMLGKGPGSDAPRRSHRANDGRRSESAQAEAGGV